MMNANFIYANQVVLHQHQKQTKMLPTLPPMLEPRNKKLLAKPAKKPEIIFKIEKCRR